MINLLQEIFHSFTFGMFRKFPLYFPTNFTFCYIWCWYLKGTHKNCRRSAEKCVAIKIDSKIKYIYPQGEFLQLFINFIYSFHTPTNVFVSGEFLYYIATFSLIIKLRDFPGNGVVFPRIILL